LAWEPKSIRDRADRRGKHVHRSGSTEHPDRDQHRDEVGNDPNGGRKSVFGPFDEFFIYFYFTNGSNEDDRKDDQRDRRRRKDLRNSNEGRFHYTASPFASRTGKNRSIARVKMIPTIRLTNVARNVGIIMSVGFAEPSVSRIAMTVAGTSVSAVVLIVRNMHIAFVAVPATGFNLFSSSIALRPSGVAAFESPRKFAVMFITMAPIAGWSGGTSGNTRTITGFTIFDKSRTSPAASAIFIIPSQSAITPMSPIASSTAVFAIFKIPSSATLARMRKWTVGGRNFRFPPLAKVAVSNAVRPTIFVGSPLAAAASLSTGGTFAGSVSVSVPVRGSA